MWNEGLTLLARPSVQLYVHLPCNIGYEPAPEADSAPRTSNNIETLTLARSPSRAIASQSFRDRTDAAGFVTSIYVQV